MSNSQQQSRIRLEKPVFASPQSILSAIVQVLNLVQPCSTYLSSCTLTSRFPVGGVEDGVALVLCSHMRVPNGKVCARVDDLYATIIMNTRIVDWWVVEPDAKPLQGLMVLSIETSSPDRPRAAMSALGLDAVAKIDSRDPRGTPIREFSDEQPNDAQTEVSDTVKLEKGIVHRILLTSKETDNDGDCCCFAKTCKDKKSKSDWRAISVAVEIETNVRAHQDAYLQKWSGIIEAISPDQQRNTCQPSLARHDRTMRG